MALAALDTAHFGFGYFVAAFDAVVDSLHFIVINVLFIIYSGAVVALDTPINGNERILV